MRLGNVDHAFTAALVAFAASLIAVPVVMSLLSKFQSKQKVSEHVPEHASKQGTPTMGGLVVLVGLVAAILFVSGGGGTVPIILIAGFALIGFVDDFIMPRTKGSNRGLGWKQKFVAQLLVALGAYWMGGVRELWVLAYLVFVVMFFANAFNFADGMDSLAGGIAVMLAIGFAIVARLSMSEGGAEQAVLIVMGALAASFVPFLLLNAPPARVFMGDIGALPVGALLGWAFLAAGRPSDLAPNHINLWVLIVMSGLLIIELLPVPLQIASVKLRKGKRLFPRMPIHHAFQHAGWPETRVVWTFHLFQAVLVAVGVGVLWRSIG